MVSYHCPIVTLSLRQFLRYSTCNYTVTLKPGFGITQGHQNRHISICIRNSVKYSKAAVGSLNSAVIFPSGSGRRPITERISVCFRPFLMQIRNGLKHTKMRSVVGHRPDSLGKITLTALFRHSSSVWEGEGKETENRARSGKVQNSGKGRGR